VLALRKLQSDGLLSRMPKLVPVAAVSVGVVKGEVLVDLDYDEDSTADVDLNLVATADGRIIEVQGTAEHQLFDRKTLDAMLDAGLAAIRQLAEAQAKVLG
jgi:ribonuclease PH